VVPGERQLVHRVDVQIFGGRSEAIQIFTPRDSPDTFDQTSFDADGSIERTVGESPVRTSGPRRR
jgi:hypothetical protein